jgi:hypothetical protein
MGYLNSKIILVLRINAKNKPGLMANIPPLVCERNPRPKPSVCPGL